MLRLKRFNLQAPRFDEYSFGLTPGVSLENIVVALVNLHLILLLLIHFSAGVKVLESLRVGA